MSRGGHRTGAGRPSTRLIVHLDPDEYAELEAIAASMGLTLEEWAAGLLRLARFQRRTTRPLDLASAHPEAAPEVEGPDDEGDGLRVWREPLDS